MGLEYVELIMELEDAFGIKLEDEDVADCRTINDLFETLKKKVKVNAKAEACLTQKTFYSIRKVLVEDLGISKKIIVPDVKTSKLISVFNRRTAWNQIQKKSTLKLPGLELSSALILFYCIIFFIFSTITAAKYGFGELAILGSLAFWIIIFFTVVRWISRPFAVVVPSECNTIGDLARSTTINNYPTVYETLSEKDIWNGLIYYVARESGENESTLKPETRFTEDLSFG